MKKLSVLLMSICGATALVACGSGSSSGSGGGVSACVNGASSCGAQASLTIESIVIPLNALPGRLASNLNNNVESPVINVQTNLYVSNKDSYDISFYVESNGVSPFIVNFSIQADDSSIPSGSSLPKFTNSTSVGQASNQCKFPSDSTGSYECTLTISPNGAPAGKYKVIGTINGGNQPFEINVVNNYQEPNFLTLPLGTYIDQSVAVTPTNGCLGMHYEPVPAGSTFVVTNNGVYSCTPDDGVCYQNTPSRMFPTPSYSPYMYNVMWSNNTFSFNLNPVGEQCYGAVLASGLVPSIKMVYSNSSQQLPYPDATSVSKTGLQFGTVK